MTTLEKLVRGRSKLRVCMELLTAVLGAALLVAALRVDREWVSRHVTQLNLWPESDPSEYVPRLRGLIAVLGVAVLVLLRPLLVRWARSPSTDGLAGTAARILLAVVCSVAAFEGYLRWREKAHPPGPLTHELFGVRHPRYGWTWAPSRTATELVGGREVHYAFNREGQRVRNVGDEPDASAPTILFTGESIAAGQGLEYDETYPALISAHLGLQSVNLAVNGYGSDQAYQRLVDAMPRFARLAATVTVFLPVQIGRQLLDDKPRLVLGPSGTPELVPASAGFTAGLRLRKWLWNEVPYLGERAIQRSLALTSVLLRETAERTRVRGAMPLFVIPSYGPSRPLNDHEEAWLVRALFEQQHLPFLLIDLPADLLIGRDPHPSPRGAAAIAAAIERVLGPGVATR